MAPKKRRTVEIIDLTNDDLEDFTSHPKGSQDGQPKDEFHEFVVCCYSGLELRVQKSLHVAWPPGFSLEGLVTDDYKAVLSMEGVSAILNSVISDHVVAIFIRNPFKDFDDIASPIVKPVFDRSKRTRFNLNTIAHDVLLAASKHPSLSGLNAHLEPLKSRFTHVDDSSDLSTFRWDVIDPGSSISQVANMTPTATGVLLQPRS